MEETTELLLLLDESCRPTSPELFDISRSLVFGATGAAELEEAVGVGVGAMFSGEEAFGTAAGQKLQTCLASSQ